MKKTLTVIIGVITLALISCQKEEIGSNSSEVSVSVTARLPRTIPTTRATGEGDHVNRCILEVYRGEELYTRVTEAVTGLQTKFELRLVSSQSYHFVFWADNGSGTDNKEDNHYITTNGLTDITFKENDYLGNDDTRDAFFASEEITVTGSFTKDIHLKRPFGQVNVQTTDWDVISIGQLKPTQVKTAFVSVPTRFNALTNEVADEKALTYTAAIVDVTNGKLSMDYILAPATGKNLIDFAMTFYNGDQVLNTNDAFKAVPVQQNYRTNITGNLLTKTGNINVNVKPEFETNDITHEIREVATIEEANAALKENGVKGVVISEAPTTDATITLPQNYAVEDEAISITLPVTDKSITITYDTEQTAHAPAAITITAPTTQQLVIDAPKSTVTLNGQKYTQVTATTAENTLLIESDVEIDQLTVNKGNVKIYGVVKALTKAQGYNGTVYRCIDSDQSFTNLVNDEVSGYTEILIERPVTALNGNNTTLDRPVFIAADAQISNLIINSEQGNGITLAADNIKVILDNLTIYQNQNDLNNGRNCAILAAQHNNLDVIVKNSHLIVPKSNQRGINVHGSTDPASVCSIVLDNTHIGPKLEILGDGDYDDTQNGIFKGLYDLRGISIASHVGNIKIELQNHSVIEGVFYAINSVQHQDNFEIRISDSRLDGRCAFNIWNDGKATIDVENSKLIGRNPFGGPTEIFATVVVNGKDGNWEGAANNTISINNSEIYCYNNPETPTNIQYAVDLRSPRKNSLSLSGTTRIYDKSSSKRLPYAVNVEYWINEVHVDPGVVMEGNATATVLPSDIWDGEVSSLKKSADDKYYIGTPQELACWVKEQQGGHAVLVRDLNLNNQPWPVRTAGEITGTFDGNNYTIRNLNCRTYTVVEDGDKGLAWDNKNQNAGLFGVFGGTLQNIKIDSAEIYGSRSGALAGRFTGGKINNCHLTNIRILGGAQKMGSLIGYVASNSSTTISNCSVRNSSVAKDPSPATGDASCQAGGFIGYLQALGQNVVIENNTLEKVTVESGHLWDQGNECASHVFVGNVINLSKTSKGVIEFKGNTLRECKLTNAQLTPLATDYFGFYYTTPVSDYPTLSKIVVNGKTLIE